MNDDEKDDKREEKMQENDIMNFVKNKAKKAKNVFSMIMKKALAAVAPIFLKAVALLIVVFTIIGCLSALFDFEGTNRVSDKAIKEVRKEEVELVQGDDGYYFKISKNVMDRFMEELNKAYYLGYFHDNVEDEEERKNQFIYDEEEQNVTKKDLAEWFRTEDIEKYIIKMIRADIASTYPKLGDFNGKPGSEDELRK
mgnify:CR=1 FL=1